MVTTLIIALLLLLPTASSAQRPVYDSSDSLRVTQLLSEAPRGLTAEKYMFHFGSELKGVPFVGHTLDREKKECLVVNLRELDCTTFVENALALTLCMTSNRRSFSDFTAFLRRIRYQDGNISYGKRLHYFTSWIDNAARNNFITPPDKMALPQELYTATKTLDINFMTTHTQLYPQLKENNLHYIIKKTEEALSGRTMSYIPKNLLNRQRLLKKHIRQGDIIVIVTRKKGLDAQHIGIASWHADGTLHLLNASQIHHKVVDEPQSLYKYMQQHPSQIGIRVLHVE